MRYRFKIGDRVRITARHPSASTGVHEHNGEIVTIMEKCPFLSAYRLKEYPDGWWKDGCFERVD